MVRIAALGALSAGVMALGQVAHAACPMASDLETGIVILDADGGGSRYRQIGEDRFLEMSVDPEDNFLFWINALGLVLQEVYFDANGQEESRNLSSYTGDNGPLPVPEPGARWSGLETWADAEGTTTFSEYPYSLEIGQAQPFPIGDCTYTVLPIDITVVDVGLSVVFAHQHVHILELGLAVYLGTDGGNGEPGDLPFVPASIAVDSGPWPVE